MFISLQICQTHTNVSVLSAMNPSAYPDHKVEKLLFKGFLSPTIISVIIHKSQRLKELRSQKLLCQQARNEWFACSKIVLIKCYWGWKTPTLAIAVIKPPPNPLKLKAVASSAVQKNCILQLQFQFHQATTDVAICLSSRDKMEIKCYLSVVLPVHVCIETLLQVVTSDFFWWVQSTSSGSQKKCTRISMIFDLMLGSWSSWSPIHSLNFFHVFITCVQYTLFSSLRFYSMAFGLLLDILKFFWDIYIFQMSSMPNAENSQ